MYLTPLLRCEIDPELLIIKVMSGDGRVGLQVEARFGYIEVALTLPAGNAETNLKIRYCNRIDRFLLR